MATSLLNLISTPVPVLNSIGLNLRVGLSSDDPTTLNYPSEEYTAYLSVYSPEGLLLKRTSLGEIPPSRRRYFDVSGITRKSIPDLDHLVVVHRIPTRLLERVSNVEDEIELDPEPSYRMFRSLVEYSYPQGGNGSVIYETPPRLNATTSGHRTSNTLTFTCQTVLSPTLNTYVIILHYSVSPAYSRIANYHFALHSTSGDRVFSDSVSVAPFSIRVLDLASIIPAEVVAKERDPQDGLCALTFVGYSEDASLPVVVVNAAPSLGAVSVEHTHPAQSYIYPWDVSYQRQAKNEAQSAWRSILAADRSS